MMTYKETINYLFGLLPNYQMQGASAVKYNLSNITKICKKLGNPQNAFKTIHIGGTNGKGSVSYYLAYFLRKSGLKTGLYTSPHLVDYRERIQVNGNYIEPEYIVKFVNANLWIANEFSPSFFEFTVAMAFSYFRDNQIDVAVIEVGMGGRLDSTNIITPMLSVITNIGYDHQRFLGHSLPEIANEKAGIIKPGVPTVIGETHPETKPVFEQKALEQNSPIYFADTIITYNHSIGPNVFYTENILGTYGSFEPTKPNPNYRTKNLITLLAALLTLKKHHILPIDNRLINQVLETPAEETGLTGRFQVVHTLPNALLDTTHNINGFELLKENLEQFGQDHWVILLGLVNEKPVEKILEKLPQNAVIIYCKPDLARGLPTDEFKKHIGQATQQFFLADNIFNGWQICCKKAKNNQKILVTGSNFIVADWIKNIAPR